MRQDKTESDQLLDFLQEQIAIPSVKGEAAAGAPFGPETVRALEHFLQRAEQDGFRTGRLDGYAGYIEFGPEEAREMVAAVCHLDVVPPGDWEEAFCPEIRGEELVGRGSADDKGPAVAVYFALRRLQAQAYQAQRRIRLILGLDEESGSACMAHYRSHGEIPVAAFTADADFPVIHAEKGLLQVAFSFPAETLRSAQGKRLLEAAAGTRPNVVPDRCSLSFEGREVVEILGKAAHASTPDEGQNAIARAFSDLGLEGETEGKGLAAFIRDCASDTAGSGLGVAVRDEVSGALTFNAAVLHYDQQGARLVCDLRYPVTLAGQELSQRMAERVAQYGGSFELLHDSLPLYLAEDHPLVAGLLEVYQRLSGEEARPLAIGGGTYARSLPNTVAFGSVFPGEVVLMHQRGESCNIPNLLRSVDYYEEALKCLDQLDMGRA